MWSLNYVDRVDGAAGRCSAVAWLSFAWSPMLQLANRTEGITECVIHLETCHFCNYIPLHMRKNGSLTGLKFNLVQWLNEFAYSGSLLTSVCSVELSSFFIASQVQEWFKNRRKKDKLIQQRLHGYKPPTGRRGRKPHIPHSIVHSTQSQSIQTPIITSLDTQPIETVIVSEAITQSSIPNS